MIYEWNRCRNPQVNVLHVSERIPRSYGSGDKPEFYGVTLDADRELIEALWRIDGVTSVSTGSYECQIIKARLFSWLTIRPAVIDCFRKRYGHVIEIENVPCWES